MESQTKLKEAKQIRYRGGGEKVEPVLLFAPRKPKTQGKKTYSLAKFLNFKNTPGVWKSVKKGQNRQTFKQEILTYMSDRIKN